MSLNPQPTTAKSKSYCGSKNRMMCAVVCLVHFCTKKSKGTLASVNYKMAPAKLLVGVTDICGDFVISLIMRCGPGLTIHDREKIMNEWDMEYG